MRIRLIQGRFSSSRSLLEFEMQYAGITSSPGRPVIDLASRELEGLRGFEDTFIRKREARWGYGDVYPGLELHRIELAPVIDLAKPCVVEIPSLTVELSGRLERVTGPWRFEFTPGTHRD